MKKKSTYIVLAIAVLVLVGIGIWKNPAILNSQPILNNESYAPTLANIKATKDSLKVTRSGQKKLESAFIKTMTNQIFPYWYGTKWDYNGTTQLPNEGKIACGYFVTTTLRDAGVPLARVKLAQCASEQMIKSLTTEEFIHRYSNISITAFDDALNDLGSGLYIVGLDNHTGFLLVTSEENYFIHSSGSFPYQVVKESTTSSKPLVRSKYRVVGRISADPRFLTKWVNG